MKWIRPFLISLIAIQYSLFAYFTERTEFNFLISLVVLIFLTKFLLTWVSRDSLLNENDFSQFQWLAVFFRLIFLFSLPNLSDDYFRFLWDGYFTVNGLNPYLYLPSEYINENSGDYLMTLFQSMNSQDYYTVYPPLNQIFFAMAQWIAGKNMVLGVLVLKLLLFSSETLIIFLLPRFLKSLNINYIWSVAYLLNPLVIIEIMGNVHFESVTLCLLLISLNFLVKRDFFWSAFFLGLSISVKLLPLIFLPLIWARIGFKKFLGYSLLSLLVFTSTFLPYADAQLIPHMMQSIDLYFQTFEFNASLYYLIRFIGYEVVGYNIIQWSGPALMVVEILIIMILGIRTYKNPSQLTSNMFYIILCYYLLATTVHPWYVINLIFLSLIGNRHILSTTLLSMLVFLSYHAYSSEPFSENLWIVSIEYSLFLVVFFIERTQRYEAFVNNRLLRA